MSETEKLILNKLDKMDDRLDRLSEGLIRNTVTLEEHVKGSLALQAIVEANDAKLNKRIRPIERAYNAVKWLIPAIGVIGGGMIGVLEILQRLGKL